MNSDKFHKLAKSTQVSYGYLLSLAERPDTLGALSVHVVRPALVQAFLDGFSDRPGQQLCARTALKSLEKWALVRDLLPHAITTGTEAPGGDGGYEPWTDEQVRLAETHARPHLARVITLGANTGQRGSDLIKMRWSDGREAEQGRGRSEFWRRRGKQTRGEPINEAGEIDGRVPWESFATKSRSSDRPARKFRCIDRLKRGTKERKG